MDQPKRKASWPFFVLGAVLLLAAVASPVAVIVYAAVHVGDNSTRIETPGEKVIRFDRAGKYAVYHEYEGVREGRTYHQAPGSFAIRCTLTRQSDNREIEMAAPGGNETYSLGGRAGQAIMQFTIDEPGLYTLVADSDEDTVLVVSDNVVHQVLWLVFCALALPVALGLLALLPIILGIVRAVRNHRLGRIPVARPAGTIDGRSS